MNSTMNGKYITSVIVTLQPLSTFALTILYALGFLRRPDSSKLGPGKRECIATKASHCRNRDCHCQTTLCFHF